MSPLPPLVRGLWTLLTLKHAVFVVLCLAAFQVHRTYRVPGRVLFLVLPWLGVVLGVLSLTVLLDRWLSRATSDNPYRSVVAGIDRWATRLILAFLVVTGLLAINGALDESSVTSHRAQIVDIVDADADLGVVVSYAWAALRRPERPKQVERVLLTPAEFETLWAGRAVVVKTRGGRLGLVWVTEIEPDWEAQQREILRLAPAAVQAWRNLVGILLERRRLDEASVVLQDYFRRFPEAYDDSRVMAAEYAWAGRHADVVAFLEPFAARRPDYEVYDLYGFALAGIGRVAEASAWLRRAIALAPTRWEAHYHLGSVCADAADVGCARQAFEVVLRLRPEFPEVRRRLERLRASG